MYSFCGELINQIRWNIRVLCQCNQLYAVACAQPHFPRVLVRAAASIPADAIPQSTSSLSTSNQTTVLLKATEPCVC